MSHLILQDSEAENTPSNRNVKFVEFWSTLWDEGPESFNTTQ